MAANAKAPRSAPFAKLVYQLVRRIPRGKVATYGQLAAILGQPRAARAVGHALRLLPRPMAGMIPWQRVINASGRISYRGDILRPELQRDLLEKEGVVFDRRDVVDLKRFLWKGPKREWETRLRSEL